ncbi:MAG: hypothetical protein U1F61_15520 [Opitutaceae bacterium]
MAWFESITFTSLQFVALWGLIGLAVVLIVLRESSTLVLARDSKGKLEISRAALHRVLEACCEQVRGIASARAHVTRKGKTYHTELRLRIRPDAKLDAIQGYLTQEITEIYHENLGLKDIGAIEIKIVGVVPNEQTF